MIELRQTIDVLLEACPSFRPAWDEHRGEHGEELPYVAAGLFAHHLLSLFRSGDKTCFASVGAAIERLHTKGSPSTREFATIGVLEGIQNVWGNGGADPEEFVRYLGPESRRLWQSLNDFWSGKVPYVGHEG